MYIGAHVSSAGGIFKALERANAIGAEVIQLFPTSPRSYKTTEYDEATVKQFRDEYDRLNFKNLFFHCIYLLNLASEKDFLYQSSIQSLIYYLTIGDKLGAVGTVVHLGSWGSSGFNIHSSHSGGYPAHSAKAEQASQVVQTEILNPLNRLVDAIKLILEKTPDSQYFIIENTAAGGGRIGANLDELVGLYEAINSSRIKFCIDTQHLFASGVDVRDSVIFSKWLAEFDKRIGIKNLICIHSNDSKTELASKSDRHENIGEGQIGLEGFKNIINQPLLQNSSFVLEVPGIDKKGPDKANIERLKSLII